MAITWRSKPEWTLTPVAVAAAGKHFIATALAQSNDNDGAHPSAEPNIRGLNVKKPPRIQVDSAFKL